MIDRAGRAEAAAKLNITAESIRAEFDEAIEMAIRKGQWSVVNKALKAKSRIITK